jgi:2-dehydro-3-deoxyphosphogluconate aldolase / (4S)-4-hydroxy-2-oxoglutarate aldolase
VTRSWEPIRTVAIFRGYPPPKAVELAERCWEAGFDLVEVPVQDERGWEALDAVIRRAEGRPVGAGTVIDAERARRAIDAGADVLITPGFGEDVIDAARGAGRSVLPGVMTPTELQRCLRIGVEACKVFPIGVLGAAYLKALRPVFPELGFVATGGVGPANAAELVAAGANALAFGGSIETILEDPTPIKRAAAAIERPWIPSSAR